MRSCRPSGWGSGRRPLSRSRRWSLVLVEDEAAVGPGVDVEGGGVGGFFADVLHGRGVGDDGAGADEDGDAVERRGGGDAAAGCSAARPVVVPLGGGGQVDGASALLVLGDGGDEQGGAEHVLVRQLACGAVGGEVHDERTHHGVAGLGGPSGQRVDVGEEGVAQAVEAELGVEGGGVVAAGSTSRAGGVRRGRGGAG